MAVKIRLKRMGAKKRPFYRVVVADARSPRDGRFIESLGYYDPLKSPKVFHVDDERIRHWMATGARPSDAVRELLVRQGTLAAVPHPLRTKTGPKRAPKPGRAPVAAPASSDQAVATEAAPTDAPLELAEPAAAGAAEAPDAAAAEGDVGVEAPTDDGAPEPGLDASGDGLDAESAPDAAGAEDEPDAAEAVTDGEA